MWSVCAVSMHGLFWHMQIPLTLTKPAAPVVPWPYWWSPMTEVLHLHWVLLIINRPIPPPLVIRALQKARWESITNKLITLWFPACLDYCSLARRLAENREQVRPESRKDFKRLTDGITCVIQTWVWIVFSMGCR